MRAILVFVCFVSLALAGCGSSDDGSSGSGGDSGSGGTGGAGNMSGSGDCQRLCESPCVDDVLDPGELAECVETCEMGLGSTFDQCLDETIAVLECIEDFDCEGDRECLNEFAAFATCIAF